MINPENVRGRAAQWMTARGWKQALAKRAGFEQSLFEHTDVELNALLTLLPILGGAEHYNLSESEQQGLIVGQVAHDVGKEILEWQEYVKRGRGQGPFVPHIDSERTAATVAELITFFGFPEAIFADACAAVNLHHKAQRTPTSMFVQAISADKNPRWETLARLVDALDNICSARGLSATLQALQHSVFARHVHVAYHLIQMRGVSTTLLHRAAIDSYVSLGWSPLLYFSTGTIYVASSTEQRSVPEPSVVEQALSHSIDAALPRSFEPFVVGSPLASFLPKPELFDYRELSFYLERAKRAVRRGSFTKKTLEARRKVVQTYWTWSGRSGAPDTTEVEEQTQRIDRAQPEILIFKFFKAAVSKDVVCGDGLPLPPEVQDKVDAELSRALEVGRDSDAAQARYTKAVAKAQDEQWQRLEASLRVAFDAQFGDGSYAALMTTSTLMPAKDLAFTVDRFWSLPGERCGLPYTYMGDAPDETREEHLIQILNTLAQGLYEQIDAAARPVRASSRVMAGHFIGDLIYPRKDSRIDQIAQEQLLAYQSGKADAKRQVSEPRLCPICNETFRRGAAAKADFLPKPESHTNRALAHGRPGNIVICNTCKYERFLQQLLLGERGDTVLVLLPHMNVGYFAGEELMQHAARVREVAEDLISTNSKRLDEHLSLQLTNLIYGKLQDLDIYRITTEELFRALTYTSREDTQRAHRKELEKGLREFAEMPAESTDVALLNAALDVEFPSWNEALDQITAGNVDDDRLDPLVREAFKLRPVLRMICQTPNMMLIPLASSFVVGKDGETNAALRQLFILLLLGLALECTVDVVRPGDPILFEGGEGIARVPPVPAVRDLIGAEWVTLDKARTWISAIGAAALLASHTAYPERSNLYQILTASTPGHILRRVEQAGSGGASLQQIKLIEQVKEVLHA